MMEDNNGSRVSGKQQAELLVVGNMMAPKLGGVCRNLEWVIAHVDLLSDKQTKRLRNRAGEARELLDRLDALLGEAA
jgi:hypothetical protein